MEDKRRQMMNVSVTLAVIAAYGLVCLWVWNPKPLRWASPAPIDTLSVLGISLARWMKGLLWFAAVVYLALAAFAIYQALPAQREDLLQRRIGNLYIRACGINVGCVLIGAILNPGKVFCLPFFAHLILAPAVVIGLAALVVIFARRMTVPTPVTPVRILLVAVPFALYAGWLVLFILVQLAVSLTSVYPG